MKTVNFKKEIKNAAARKSNKQLIAIAGVVISCVAITIIALLVMAGIMALVACGVAAVGAYVKRTRSREKENLRKSMKCAKKTKHHNAAMCMRMKSAYKGMK